MKRKLSPYTVTLLVAGCYGTLSSLPSCDQNSDGGSSPDAIAHDARSKEASSHDGGNGSFSDDGPTITVSASSYNQTCSEAGDCVLVQTGTASCNVTNVCRTLCFCNPWPTDAINVSDIAKLTAATTAAIDAGCNCGTADVCGPVGCDVEMCPGVSCVDGGCQVVQLEAGTECHSVWAPRG
jgi:hypothetical protein